MRVEFSAAAESDLRDISLFIGADNPSRALSFALELRQACRDLQTMARRFEMVLSHGDRAIHRRVYRGYSIFYAVGERVQIVRIIHGAAVTEEFIDNL